MVLRDVVLAPLVITVALVALVILLPVTLLAVPELGRFGALPDSATLQDRHHWLGWSLLVTLVVAGVPVGALSTRRRTAGRRG